MLAKDVMLPLVPVMYGPYESIICMKSKENKELIILENRDIKVHWDIDSLLKLLDAICEDRMLSNGDVLPVCAIDDMLKIKQYVYNVLLHYSIVIKVDDAHHPSQKTMWGYSFDKMGKKC